MCCWIPLLYFKTFPVIAHPWPYRFELLELGFAQQVSDRVVVFTYYMNIPCKNLTEESVNIQCNVTLYIQKIVLENAGNAVLEGWKNTSIFWGRIPPYPPITHHTNIFSPRTICHRSTLSIAWSLFVDGPFHGRILKKDPDTTKLAKCHYTNRNRYLVFKFYAWLHLFY